MPPERILVVIPTYNEAENVESLCDGIWALLPDLPVLFVDDNSQDGTRDRIAAMMSRRPGVVHILKRSGKLGLGTAYIAGFKWAFANGYDAVVEMDADHSHRPEDLAKIVAALKTHPVAVGSRYIPGGGTVNWSLGRKLISRFGSLYGRVILGMKTMDLTGGFNGWHREALQAIGLDSVKSEGYSFQIELKYRAKKAGYPIHEVPITFTERRAGQSKMSSKIVFEAMVRVWGLRFK